MRCAHLTNARGTTLVELLLVGAIAVGLSSVFWVLAEAGRNIWASTDATMAGLTSAQIVLNRLSEESHQANQSSLSCAANRVTLTPLAGAPVTYRLAGATLIREQGGTSQIIASNISVFTPVCGGNLLTLYVTTQVRTISGGAVTTSVQSKIWIPNAA